MTAALLWLLERLPRQTLLALGRIVGRLWHDLVPIRRRVAREQMQRAFPDWSEARVKRTVRDNFINIASTFGEALCIPRLAPTLPPWFSESGLEHFRNAQAKGKGVVVITAHLGNFELFSVLMSIAGIDLTIVVRPIKNRALDARWNAIRRRFGTRVLIARRRLGAMKEILSELRAGRGVALVIDQNMNRGSGVFVDFFGRPANTMDLPALLAKRTGAPVIAAFMVRQPSGDHHAIVLPEVPWQDAPRGEDLVVNTQRYTRIVEDMVREHPEQWFWVHRRWKTQP